uniref:Tyrosine-protein kinase n=1 Tax=Trichuris muris TaxID=70415 RepID=A0A5S6QFI7_TRIMR
MGNCCETAASASARRERTSFPPMLLTQKPSTSGCIARPPTSMIVGVEGPLSMGGTPSKRLAADSSMVFLQPTAKTGKRSVISGQVVLVALHSYESMEEGDLSFKKGDLMILHDNSNTDWWYVKHLNSEQSGYVPRTYVALQESPESEEWYAGDIPRNLAVKLVLNPDLPQGTFLIRERQNDPGEYALTIRDRDQEKGPDVKHYRIRRLENGGFYITTRQKFRTLQELVRFYSETADGLCCKLTQPCPKRAPVRSDLSRETQKNWEISKSELQYGHKLGQGNFGEVWYGKFRKSDAKVAIKMLKAGSMSCQAFFEEASIMKQCDHPNLVKLYAVCTKEEPMCIVTEYMVNGSLLEYLRAGEGKMLPLSALVDMCAQIANGMAYLEEHRMVHRDLAARNILVGEKIAGIPTVKVADFGLARVIQDDEYNARTGAKFPIKWTAPEAALYGTFTVKSDVWSYGILLYEVITKGQTPYPGMQNREVIEQVENGYRMPRPRDCPQAMYDVMRQTWDSKPEDRPTFEYLYHFFDDYFVSVQPSYAQSEG